MATVDTSGKSGRSGAAGCQKNKGCRDTSGRLCPVSFCSFCGVLFEDLRLVHFGRHSGVRPRSAVQAPQACSSSRALTAFESSRVDGRRILSMSSIGQRQRKLKSVVASVQVGDHGAGAVASVEEW